MPEVEVVRRPYIAKVRVQQLPGHDGAGALRRLFAGGASIDWDLEPNRTCGSDPVQFWLSPVERLIVSCTWPAAALRAAVATACAASAEIVTDVSCASAVLRVSGAGAVEALASDCALDLDGAEMAPGCCAQIVFAQTSVLIHRLPAAWDLYVERPALTFVHDWIVRAAGALKS